MNSRIQTRGRSLLLVFLLVLQHSFSVLSLGSCPQEWTASDGTIYDLSLLPGSVDFVWVGTSFTYSWNLCMTQTQPKCPSGTSVCKYNNNEPVTYISVGDLNTQAISDGKDGPNTGVTITYTNPAVCSPNTIFTTNIYLVCDKTVTETTFVQFSPGTCVYKITMNSPYACPKEIKNKNDGKESLPEKLGGGSIFLIALLCASVLYFGVGSLVRWKGMHQTGKDILPHADFWLSIPGLVKDGFLFTKNKITGGGSSTYQKL
eukprot:TRINITY_DN2747_c0_g1_i4.p1 TRINITY_DN2747_c0_g1~~TRINITY_DN2747_c0_g1_i4.p1  ORF type:complete len:260 (-),score=43.65 TRINITY_DN2747_c0_g1_i4:105-884(-)